MKITAETLRKLPPEQRAQILGSLSPEESEAMYFDWDFWARPEQVWRPGAERHTVYICGRGWGKSSTGANAVIWMSRHPEECAGSIGIAGRTANDVNETMIEEGILRWSPPDWRPVWNMHRKTLVWPNGCRARLYSGDVPTSFRGPNIGFLWADELPHWMRAAKSWEQAMLALRAGKRSRSVVTTTPIGVPTIVRLVYKTDRAGVPLTDDAGAKIPNPRSRVIRGTTYDNRPNLSADFYEEVLANYEGTRLGLQEIHGEILLGIKGAPWEMEWIDTCEPDDLPMLNRVVIGIDPSGGKNEIGIIVVGQAGDKFYVLEDCSGEYSPEGWATAALEAWTKWNAHPKCADARFLMAVEDNFGGDMVESTLQMVRTLGLANKRKWSDVRIKRVKATRDKFKRADLVAPLWELGKVSRVGPPRRFVKLEFQMTNADPSRPTRDQELDRMDALVWAMLELSGDGTDRGVGMRGLVGMQAELMKRLGR